MGRACRVIATGVPIEWQSHATPGTLVANAVAAGYAAEAVEEVIATYDEYRAMLPTPDPVLASDARVDKEDDTWFAALLNHLPAILAEYSATGDVDAGKWRQRIRATVKTLRRPRG